jgi:ABC-2 type transport system ATP-binding protein
MSGVIEASHLTYRYGRTAALDDLSVEVPEGALYALIGPNGSGKTTLLQLVMGLRRSSAGRLTVFGVDCDALTRQQRADIGYIAEGQRLPQWMRLQELEAYLAPLYPGWDQALATDLRQRFELDPRQRIGALSRGGQMKAALLCALAPRPRLLVMDEPFTGMDVLVKDELVHGLLETAGQEGWSVLLCSHDIGELELLADWVGFLDHGHVALSESVESLRARFKRVEARMADEGAVRSLRPPADWMSVERAGSRISFITPHGDVERDERLRALLPHATDVEVRDASLRELFIALATSSARRTSAEVAA